MTNQRRTLGILWSEIVTNKEVASPSQLSSINEAISRRKHSLFSHVRRMDQAAPAYQALHLSVIVKSHVCARTICMFCMWFPLLTSV